ncbi:MAG: hypothetical protein ITF98_10370 [Fermentimonas sp.]|nr:hypothetical protein [Fermentimonas sp.]
MKKYLIEIGLYFLLPATLLAVVSEYSLRKIPNDYAFKNQWLTINSRDVEVLALGASTVLYDINPQYLNKKGFNAAHLSQSLKYDHFIFHKFIDQMPSLEYVILGIEFWSPFGDIEDSPEWWRVKFYNIHYGSNFHRWQGKYNYELYFKNAATFKTAANGLLTIMGLKDESRRTVNDMGYGANYTLDKRQANWDNGEFEANRHNSIITHAIDKNNIIHNKKYVNDIIRECEKRNIKVLLINLPLYTSYRNSQKEEYLTIQKDFCISFDEQYDNVFFYDFSNIDYFTEHDYYDANHLNEIGSKKITLMLDSIIHKK